MSLRGGPRSSGASTDLEQMLARPPGRSLQVVTSDGVSLHVEVDEPTGTGRPGSEEHGEPPTRPTVVLSHGYTLDHRSWVYQRHALTDAGYRVVVWDQRGHGRSGFGDHRRYTIDQLGEDLHRVVEVAAPGGSIALVGHSMGAMTVMAYAGTHPDQVTGRVSAVALLSTSAAGLDRVRWGLGERLGTLVNRVGPVLTQRLAPRQDVLRALRRWTPGVDEISVMAPSFGSRVPRDVSRLTADMIFESDLAVMSAFAPALRGHDKREALSVLSGVPTLIVVGDRDVLTAPLHSSELAELLPHAQHVVISRGGHIIIIEHPEVVTHYLLSLLSRGRLPHQAVSSTSCTNPGDAQRAARALAVRHTVVDLHPGRGRRVLTMGRRP